MKKISTMLVLLCFVLCLASCSIKSVDSDSFVKKYYHYHVLGEKLTGAIDLRDLETEYAEGHIKGFVNYNYQNGNKEEFVYFVTSLYNKSAYIFLIDNEGEYVHEAAEILKEEGYKNIIICPDGYKSVQGCTEGYLAIIQGTDDCGC